MVAANVEAPGYLKCAGREALREYDRSHQSHGKDNVRITLEPGRKNLLRLRE
jgi:hypothetical protein